MLFSVQGVKKISLQKEDMERLLHEHCLEKRVREQSCGGVAVSSVAHMVYIDLHGIDQAVPALPFIYSLGVFSAVSVGLQVHLWTYHKVIEALPLSGVTIRNAAVLVPLAQCKQCLAAGLVAIIKVRMAFLHKTPCIRT